MVPPPLLDAACIGQGGPRCTPTASSLLDAVGPGGVGGGADAVAAGARRVAAWGVAVSAGAARGALAWLRGAWPSAQGPLGVHYRSRCIIVAYALRYVKQKHLGAGGACRCGEPALL